MRIFGRRRSRWVAGVLYGAIYGTTQLVIVRGSLGDRALSAAVGAVLVGCAMAYFAPRGEERLFTVDGAVLPPAQRDEVYDAIDRGEVPSDTRLQLLAAKVARTRVRRANIAVQAGALAAIIMVFAIFAVFSDARDWIIVAAFVALTPWLIVKGRRTRETASGYLTADAACD